MGHLVRNHKYYYCNAKSNTLLGEDPWGKIEATITSSKFMILVEHYAFLIQIKHFNFVSPGNSEAVQYLKLTYIYNGCSQIHRFN